MTTRPVSELPPAAYAAALASLPGAGPVSLRTALSGRSPQDAWVAVRKGTITRPPRRVAPAGAGSNQLTLPGSSADQKPSPASNWREFAVRCDLQQLWQAMQDQRIGATWLGDDRYPSRLCHDDDGPPIVFWRGDLECLSIPTVAVVGTRHCTPMGRAVAREMGLDLADAGVCVVSGLALGIDGAAHRGALASKRTDGVTAGIAASGVDVAYPRQHRDLWEQVVTRGVVVGETAPGRPAQAWRFPARNRIIAALADLVVVVESFEAGGSMLTVDAALARGVEVRAVPGPVLSPASSGTNRLLVDGAAPVRHAGDVLDALGIDRCRGGSQPRGVSGPPSARADPWASSPAAPGSGDAGSADAGSGAATAAALAAADTEGGPSLGPLERRVFEAVGWAPTLLGRIVERSGYGVGATVGALARLESAGLVTAGDSWWVRRADP